MRITSSFFALLVLSAASCQQSRSYVFSELGEYEQRNVVPVLVCGGGVAGLTAANYLAQANIPVLVAEGLQVGGALAQSDSVRNWPGKIDVPGMHIVKELKEQALAAGVSIVSEELVAVDCKQWPYSCILKNKNTGEERLVKTLSAVMAMGASPHYLGIPGERGDNGYWGKGVSNCAICDGALYKDKRVAIVGGGDAAVAEALYLAGIAQEVMLFIRKSYFKGNDVRSIEMLKQHPSVKIFFESELKKIEGDGQRVNSISVYSLRNKEYSTVAVDGVFLAIGSSPNSSLLQRSVKCDDQGYVIVDKAQKTNVAGIFAAGDIADPVYKQAITAASDGCKAALGVIEFLYSVNYRAPLKNNYSTVQHEQVKVVIQEVSTVNDLKKILATEKRPVILDFSAELCIDCQILDDSLAEILKKFNSAVCVYKINLSDTNFNLHEFQKLIPGDSIQKAPTLIFVKNGQEVCRLVEQFSVKEISTKIGIFFNL